MYGWGVGVGSSPYLYYPTVDSPSLVFLQWIGAGLYKMFCRFGITHSYLAISPVYSTFIFVYILFEMTFGDLGGNKIDIMLKCK